MGSNNPVSEDRVWCAVPVYNNRETLREVVEGCLSVLENVVVVDDGSTDADVPGLLEGLPAVVLSHGRNMGKGAAILTASRHVEAHGGLYMVTIDADGQHDPGDIGKFLPLLSEDQKNLVIGCRNFDTENVPERSRFGRKFANFWLRVEVGVHVDDCQSGFRAYPVKHLNRIRFHGLRYDFEAEALARSAWAGLTLRTVEIGVWYPPPDERISHFRPFMDNLRLSLSHARLVGRRLLPFPHKKLVPVERPDLKVLLHPVKGMKMLLKEHSTPGGLAVSAAVGVLFATLPFFFMHTLVILYVATRLNLNKIVALNVQHLCMPPFVPALCIETGYFLRNGNWLTEISYETVAAQAPSRFWEWVLGSLVIAPLLALLVGMAVYILASALNRQRAVNA